MDGTSWLDELVRVERIRLRRGALLDTPPPRIAPRRDRIDGMLLGLAIGDSFENISEGLTPDQRADLYGESRDCLPNRFANGRAAGCAVRSFAPIGSTWCAFIGWNGLRPLLAGM